MFAYSESQPFIRVKNISTTSIKVLRIFWRLICACLASRHELGPVLVQAVHDQVVVTNRRQTSETVHSTYHSLAFQTTPILR